MILVIRILTSNPLMISESTPMTAVSPGTWTDPEIAATMGRLNLKVAVARCLKIKKGVGSLLEPPTVGEGDKREATKSGVCGLRDALSEMPTVGEGDKREATRSGVCGLRDALSEMPTLGEGDEPEATRSGVCGLRDDTSFLASFFIITESAMVGDKKHVTR